jgi:hypothetical protein
MEAALLAFKLNKLRDFYHVLNKIISKKSEKPLDQIESVIMDMRKFEDLQKQDFLSPQSIDENKVFISKIVITLLKENKAKLLTIIRNLNAKYEYAHLAQYLMAEVLP